MVISLVGWCGGVSAEFIVDGVVCFILRSTVFWCVGARVCAHLLCCVPFLCVVLYLLCVSWTFLCVVTFSVCCVPFLCVVVYLFLCYCVPVFVLLCTFWFVIVYLFVYVVAYVHFAWIVVFWSGFFWGRAIRVFCWRCFVIFSGAWSRLRCLVVIVGFESELVIQCSTKYNAVQSTIQYCRSIAINNTLFFVQAHRYTWKPRGFVSARWQNSHLATYVCVCRLAFGLPDGGIAAGLGAIQLVESHFTAPSQVLDWIVL